MDIKECTEQNEIRTLRPEQIDRKHAVLSLRARLIFLLFVIAIPLTGMVLGIQNMFESYSGAYDGIMENLKIANNYNLSFKEDMEYSMYRVMIGLIDAGQFENGDIVEGTTKYATVVKNPHSLIASARQAFEKTIDREAGSDCDIKIRGILSCLDSLERAVDKMIANSAEGGKYDENVSIWENDIQGLCSMIQEYITQYIYYETINMEHLQNELKLKMADRMQGYLALLAMVLIVGSCCSAAITRSITDPLRELRQTAEQLGSGNLDARARTGGLEEISVLAQAFNQMSDRIRRLLDKTRQEQKNLRELELRLLQEQISPHFLYNTLDTIKWEARIRQVPRIAVLAENLAIILRKSISSKPFIPLREELETIDSYVEVQKIRFTGRFLCEKEIPDQLEECLVPKMILQPLVENAIIHGLEGCENGYICIYAGREGDVLNISITDDGRGMSPEILAWINSPEPEKREGHLGLYNIMRILKLYYGNEYGLKAEVTEDGTTVTLRLPDVRSGSFGA